MQTAPVGIMSAGLCKAGGARSTIIRIKNTKQHRRLHNN